MTPGNHKSINRIARSVREWIIDFYGLAKDHDLGCYCAIASYLLYRKLVNIGLKPNIYVYDSQNIGHVYLEIDNYIIDITASQFGKEEVVLIPSHKRLVSDYFWNESYKFSCTSELQKYLKDYKWPTDQQVTKKTITAFDLDMNTV